MIITDENLYRILYYIGINFIIIYENKSLLYSAFNGADLAVFQLIVRDNMYHLEVVDCDIELEGPIYSCIEAKETDFQIEKINLLNL